MAIFKKQKQKGQKAAKITHEEVRRATEKFFKAGGRVTELKPMTVNPLINWYDLEESLNDFDDMGQCVDMTYGVWR